MILQLAFVLTAIIIGARLGGIGLGVMGGIGLGILTFVFGLQSTAPPIDVMLMIVAVISAAACMQAARRIGPYGQGGRTLIKKESGTRHNSKPVSNLRIHVYRRYRPRCLFRTSGNR